MKKQLLRRWWVVVLIAALIGAPFALRQQNAGQGQSPPSVTLSARDNQAAKAAAQQIDALHQGSAPEDIAAARADFDALPYADRYAMEDSADKLALLERALEQAVSPAPALEDPIPESPAAAEPPAWEDDASRLEILLTLLPPELDGQMSDLLATCWAELTPAQQAALPQEVLVRLLPLTLAATPDDTVDGTGDGTREDPSPAKASPEPEKTSTGSYVGSKNSDKYHVSSCTSAKRIKEHNLVRFDSAQDARQRGYTPCSVCSPG